MRRHSTGHWYVTREAESFKSAVRLFARGKSIVAKKYQIDFIVFLGKDKRGDPDNFCKVIGDGLKEAGVIHSDSKVRWTADTGRDWNNPRTEITVKAA